MSSEDREKLKELATANTDGNESALIRSLIRMAYMMPSQYGLIDPHAEGKALALAAVPA